MATLSASRRNSNTSNTASPRPSLANISKMVSVNEEILDSSQVENGEHKIEIENELIQIENGSGKEEKVIDKEKEIVEELIEKEIKDELKKCRKESERSDSGFSDCSLVTRSKELVIIKENGEKIEKVKEKNPQGNEN